MNEAPAWLAPATWAVPVEFDSEPADDAGATAPVYDCAPAALLSVVVVLAALTVPVLLVVPDGGDSAVIDVAGLTLTANTN